MQVQTSGKNTYPSFLEKKKKLASSISWPSSTAIKLTLPNHSCKHGNRTLIGRNKAKQVEKKKLNIFWKLKQRSFIHVVPFRIYKPTSYLKNTFWFM